MEFFATLLAQDPASPRLTVYDETSGARLDFSATTLNNWACKIANMLSEEFDLVSGDTIGIALPSGWQSCVLACGANAIGVDVAYDTAEDVAVLFASPDRVPADADCEVCLITTDPFGRGVEETGGQVPDGMVDFGPVVRMYDDAYAGPSRTLEEVLADYPGADALADEEFPSSPRVLSTGFADAAGFARCVLSPWAAGGSAIVVLGMASTQRLEAIAQEEKATTIL
ncbi:TIGR03089 family protein [Corynebacterium sp. 13CS0277]|uniref:TIGR03089 family protein n=1 Tax=Corynebacterium sp. 13CS0277 TaxID=2071994 RepID=UPI000D02D286|nr:TIGR03089 family protein [Corynebacterium sp. 13CS0277]PRQ10797.1 TIGR03089 family protein [Corynebacterium sp. 13CS0277]